MSQQGHEPQQLHRSHGGHYREVQTVGGLALVGVAQVEASLHFPEPDYVLTLDADSVLFPEYCLRLVYLLEAAGAPAITRSRRPLIAPSPVRRPGSSGRRRYHGPSAPRPSGPHLLRRHLLARRERGYPEAGTRRRSPRSPTSATGRSRTYIKDRTAIEDTDPHHMGLADWGLFNVPGAALPTPPPRPDFGSLSIQRRRWATGGTPIVRKLRRPASACRHRW